MTDDKQAKVDIILNVNSALANIEKLQNKLDNISIKRLNTGTATQLFDSLNKNTDSTITKVENLRTSYVKAIKDMSSAMDKNRTSFTFQYSDEFKTLSNHVNGTKRQLGHIINLFDKLRKEQRDVISQSTLTKISELNIRLKTTVAHTDNLTKSLTRLKDVDIESLFGKLENTLKNIRLTEVNEQIKGLEKSLTHLDKATDKIRNNIKNSNKISNNSNVAEKPKNLTTSDVLDNVKDTLLFKFRSGLLKSVTTMTENYLASIPTSIFNSIKQFEQNRVNFAQVMPNDIAENQELMNNTMKEFTQIASDYGATVQDVVEAGRLWGRQYKDIAIVESLVRNTTKLSITDNMSLVEVNKALEATMQQYNVKLKDYNEAQLVGNHVIDTWAKLADNAVVTASDLAKANEQSAGAAYQAGIGFDYLQALITTMSTATGKAGAEVGRSIRSMLVSMNTDKAKKFFNELDIATTELGADGVMHVRSYEKIITELMDKLQKSPKDVSKIVLAMSGGRRTCPLL